MHYLCVIYVVHLVEDDELYVSNKVCTLVQHTPQNLSSHDQAVCLWVDLDIASKDANVCSAERRLEVAILLVRECFDGRGVDGAGGYHEQGDLETCLGNLPGHVLGCQCNGVFGDNSFTSGRMRSNEN